MRSIDMQQHRCPVCDMESEKSQWKLERFGILYFFCTQQCLENFQSHPELYSGRQAEDMRGKRVMKARSFTVTTAMTADIADRIKKVLYGMMGVWQVDISEHCITIHYDLVMATSKQVEAALEEAGLSLGGGWVERLKRGWMHYTEENELDNMAASDMACCNRPPRNTK